MSEIRNLPLTRWTSSALPKPQSEVVSKKNESIALNPAESKNSRKIVAFLTIAVIAGAGAYALSRSGSQPGTSHNPPTPPLDPSDPDPVSDSVTSSLKGLLPNQCPKYSLMHEDVCYESDEPSEILSDQKKAEPDHPQTSLMETTGGNAPMTIQGNILKWIQTIVGTNPLPAFLRNTPIAAALKTKIDEGLTYEILISEEEKLGFSQYLEGLVSNLGSKEAHIYLNKYFESYSEALGSTGSEPTQLSGKLGSMENFDELSRRAKESSDLFADLISKELPALPKVQTPGSDLSHFYENEIEESRLRYIWIQFSNGLQRLASGIAYGAAKIHSFACGLLPSFLHLPL